MANYMECLQELRDKSLKEFKTKLKVDLNDPNTGPITLELKTLMIKLIDELNTQQKKYANILKRLTRLEYKLSDWVIDGRIQTDDFIDEAIKKKGDDYYEE
jgi:hypothetical protein